MKKSIIAITVTSVLLLGCNENGSSSAGGGTFVPGNAIDISAEQSNWDAGASKWLGVENPTSTPVLGHQNSAPQFRKEFTVPDSKKIEKATLKIAAYGLYVANVNGKRVGTQVLDPGPSAFSKSVLYTAFDIKQMINNGDNAISLLLGRGHLGVSEKSGFYTMIDLTYRGEPRVMAEINIIYSDGSEQKIGTDSSWSYKASGIKDALMYGEIHDSRLDTADSSLPGLDSTDWTPATEQAAPTESISPRLHPPVKIAETIEPIDYIPLSSTSGVYDFGKVTAGWAKISVTGSSGQEVELKYGEQLDSDGTVFIHDAIGTSPYVNYDKYILNGSDSETWEPEFTRHGFRYVQVNFPNGIPTKFNIQGVINYSELSKTGTFNSSNDLINKLYDNQKYVEAINMWGWPSDTPWRDRSPWAADIWLYMQSLAYDYDINDFYANWFKHAREMQGDDGSLGALVPDLSGFSSTFIPNDPSWGGTYILSVWHHYNTYGDISVLNDNYNAMKSWANKIENTISQSEYVFKGFTFGDWAPPGSEVDGQTKLSPPEDGVLSVSANGDLYLEIETMEKSAIALGLDDDATHWKELKEKIGSAFNDEFLDKSAGIYRSIGANGGYRQTSNLIPLYLGIVPEEYKKTVYDNLVNDINDKNIHLDTGAIGTRLLLPVLTDNGDGELAYKLLTQNTYPSWGYWVSKGANTSWETWDITGLKQAMSHPFLGTYQSWLYEYLAGIKASEPGYSAITLKPTVPQDLNSASASFRTKHGKIVSSWKKDSSSFIWSVTVPKGVKSTIYVPHKVGTIVTVDAQYNTPSYISDDGSYATYTTTGDNVVVKFTAQL